MTTSATALLTLTTLSYLVHAGKDLKGVNIYVPAFVPEGEDVVLTCQAVPEDSNLFSVRWYKDDQQFYSIIVNNDPKKMDHRLDGLVVDLYQSDLQKVTLREVNLSAEGRYRCEVMLEGPLFSTLHSSADMQMIESLRWVNFSVPAVVTEGDDAVLTCQVNLESKQIYAVTWYKGINEFYHYMPNDVPPHHFFDLEGLTVDLSQSDLQKLTLPNVTLDAEGEYRCEVSSDTPSFPTISKTGHMDVIVPPSWIVEPTDTNLEVGSDASLECKVDGNPKPTVGWKKAAGRTPGDYHDIDVDNLNVKVAEDGTLQISKIKKYDEGYYLCEANNGIRLSAAIYIRVLANESTIEERVEAMEIGFDRQQELLSTLEFKQESLDALMQKVAAVLCNLPSKKIPGLGCVTPVANLLSWEEARQNCQKEGGRLLQGLTSTQQLQLLKEHFRIGSFGGPAWLGIFDGKWTEGEDTIVPSSLWGESDSSQGYQLCGFVSLMYPTPNLQNFSCTMTFFSLCQKFFV